MRLRCAVLAILTTSLSFAGTIDFSQASFASAGTISPGEPWDLSFQSDNSNDLVFSIPDSVGTTPWNGNVGVIGFSFTLLDNNEGLSGFDTSATPTCIGAGLVICDGNTDTPWTSQISGSTISFTAPSGDVVMNGTWIFVDLPMTIGQIISQGTSQGVSGPITDSQTAQIEFQGSWTTVDAVPEPASVTLLGTGLAGLAFAVRKRLLAR